MSASFQTVASAGGPQFDLPPIAPATQIAQQAAPFSELLNQAQSAAPIPASSPPPTTPATPAPKSKATPQPADSNPDDSSTGPSSTPQQASGGETSQSSGESNGAADNSTEANQPAAYSPRSSSDQPQQARPDGKQAQAEKTGGTSSPQPSTTQPAVQTAGAAVSDLSSQLVAKNVASTKAKDGEKTSDAKKDGSDQSADAAPSTPADAGAQAAAAAVATLPATAPVEQNIQGATKAKAVAAKPSAKQTAVPAGAQPQPQTTFVPAAAQATTSVETTTDVPASAGKLPVHANNANATSTADQAPKSNLPAGTSQADTTAAMASVAVNLPQAADVVTTVAAIEAPVVSTITVDASTPAVPSSAGQNVSPTTGSAPDDSPPNNTVSTTPSAFAATMTQNATSASSPATGLNAVDRARFVQRVASAFQAVGDEGGQIRLRLSPPDLGSLQMQISVKQGVLSATIQADNSTAQQALLDSLPDLRDRLAQQDIRIERFDVELMGQGSGGMPQPQSNPDFNQAAPRASGRRVAATASTLPESDPSLSRSSLSTAGALNVVV